MNTCHRRIPLSHQTFLCLYSTAFDEFREQIWAEAVYSLFPDVPRR